MKQPQYHLAGLFSLLSLVAARPQGTTGIGPATPPKGAQPTDIPQVGLGTFSINNRTIAQRALDTAFSVGFRHVDTAMIYNNEVNIGAGIKYALERQNLTRKDIWVTTKLWNTNHGDPELGLKNSLEKLQLDYVDLYLMHFPAGSAGQGQPSSFDHVETWKKMEKLIRPNGRVRFIGVSNFSPSQMNELLAVATIRPKVHQFELHPYLPQTQFLEWHKKNNIPVTGYAPLGNTSPYYSMASRDNGTPPLLQNAIIKEVAAARNCSPAQVVLAWNIKRGVAVIPKAAQDGHIKENIVAGKCQLTDEDSKKIDSISIKSSGRFNNPCKRFKAQCFQGLEHPTQGI